MYDLLKIGYKQRTFMNILEKKAFFFDFDGTIWFGRYGEKTLYALKKLSEQGWLLFYNSGRSKGNTRFERLKEINFDGFLYGGSHAEVFGKELFREDISREVIDEIIKAEEKYDLDIIYEGVFGVYKRKGKLPQYNGEEQDDIGILLDTKTYPITKFSIIKKRRDEILWEKISSDAIKVLEKNFKVIEHDHYYECILLGNDKGTLMEKVISHLGLKKENVYAFGDSNNDLEMFKVGGHNIAINHSPKILKSMAEYVTTEEENGVYEALVHLGLIVG